MTPFDVSSFDLGAYCARIGYQGPLSADLTTLRAVALQHPLAIPFENLNPLLRRPVPLDLDSLQRKLVHGGRGGWCFEHNILLGTALRALGFTVTGLAARVMWNMPAGTSTPRSHMVLLIDLGGDQHIVDAGFGGLTLSGPLALVTDVEQETPHERFRLVAENGYFHMQARIRDDWKALYRFELQRQELADYEVSSWYLTTSPKSHFLSTLVAARVERDRRYTLRNTDFAMHQGDGFTERRPLTTVAEIRDALTRVFRIDVPVGDEVEATLATIVAAAPATASS